MARQDHTGRVMKRQVLEQLASALAKQVNDKPFEHWAQQAYPITWEQEHDGSVVQVEIVTLEKTEGFIRLSVAVDDGGWSAFLPASADAIIHRSE